MKYEPVVDCEARPKFYPTTESCNKVLNTVPAYKKTMSFGTTGDWHNVPGRLPREFELEQRTWTSCYIQVTMPPDSAPTEATWFDIWAAGVAVNTMCIQHEFTGNAIMLGANDQITISLGVNEGGIAQNVTDVGASDVTS